MILRGYSEKDEQYLLKLMQERVDLDLFKTICMLLESTGSIFSLPVLMAFAKDAQTQKGLAALRSIDGQWERVKREDTPEMRNFFNPSWWQPKWIGGKDKFISYVACLSNLLNKNNFFEGEFMDKTAEMLMREIDVDLAPYKSFRELRLCTSEWDIKTDMYSILGAVDEDLLMGSILKDGQIEISPDSQFEENVINMRCTYLLTRLGLKDDDGQLHYLLVKAEKLNKPE